MAKAKKPAGPKHTLSGQLREVIGSRELTAYAVGQLAGVDAAVIARFAVTSSSPRSTSVRSLSGLGITFKVTSVMTASVPQDPASNLQRS